METSQIVLLTLILMLVIGFAFYYLQSIDTIRKKDSLMANLENDKRNLESSISLLQSERENVKLFLKNVSEVKESNLRNPTWSELKIFLESDDTNRMIYNESFDCSGFTIELFKRARDIGLRCGIAEVEYEKDTSGHMLNVFQTADKGLIFVDMTGNENGTGRDKISYVEIGKPYGTIELDGIKEKRISCDITCSQLAKELTYIGYTNVFDYDYFVDFNNCIKFYKSCSDLYNVAVDDYNKRRSNYIYSELQTWFKNLGILEKELVGGNFFFLSESEIVKDIEVYW